MNNTYDIMSQHGEIKGMTPNIVEEREMNIAVLDVFSRLMKDRIVFLGNAIDDQLSNIIVSQLLFLENVDSESDITMYINSGGGSCYSGLSIYSAMSYIKPDVSTITTGIAASMAYVLAVSGAKGKRGALPYARLMQHQPLSGMKGSASDLSINNREVHKLKYELYEIIAHHTGNSIDKIYEDCDRDHWMRADEAKEYGAIDNILSREDDFKPAPLSKNLWKRGM